jgi:cyclopropane fatty-acyl-phospholipid synthase-like methyltransferase
MEASAMSNYKEAYLPGYASTHPVYSRPGVDTSPGRRAQIRGFLLRHLPIDAKPRLLDIGCGDGALLRVAADLGVEDVQGVDLSPEMAQKANALGFAVKLRDVLSFLRDQPDNSFDVVCAFDVLEHLDIEKLASVCENVLRVLTKKGKFLIHVPNGASPYSGRVLYGDITHERAFTSDSLKQVLRTAGFATVEAEEDQPQARGFVSALRRQLWRIARLATVFRLAIETGVLRGYLLTLNIFVIASKS